MSISDPHWLPWHSTQRQHLENLIRQDRLAHAWLFHGPVGVGKLTFANMLAFRMLCHSPVQNEACRQCHSCQLFLAGHHPDLRLLEADEGKQIIGVDKVRATVEFMHKTSNQGGTRIVIVPKADNLNINAANALLKTMEEPPAKTLLVLLTREPGLLLATVRSRCQPLLFPVPAVDAALPWLGRHRLSGNSGILLELAGGAPLLALQYDDQDWLQIREKVLGVMTDMMQGSTTALRGAQSLDKLALTSVVDIFLLTIHQLQRARILKDRSEITDNSIAALCTRLPEHAAIALDTLYRKLLAIRKDQQRGLAMNARLAVDDILLNWKSQLTENNSMPSGRALH
jgi:DNA polymerase-3 subunit delta'